MHTKNIVYSKWVRWRDDFMVTVENSNRMTSGNLSSWNISARYVCGEEEFVWQSFGKYQTSCIWIPSHIWWDKTYSWNSHIYTWLRDPWEIILKINLFNSFWTNFSLRTNPNSIFCFTPTTKPKNNIQDIAQSVSVGQIIWHGLHTMDRHSIYCTVWSYENIFNMSIERVTKAIYESLLNWCVWIELILWRRFRIEID